MTRICLPLLLLSVSAFAEDGEWQTVLSGPISIKNRAMPDSPLREVWAEGELAAPLISIQEALLESDGYRFFMPYVKESKILPEKPADGSFFSYIMLELPIVGRRDYALRTWLDSSANPDNTGVFKYHWVAVTEAVPEREGVQRIKKNSGSWQVTPKPGGKKCHAIYKFAIDPGGWLPAFAVNFGNERGVVDTFTAVEKEAQRRRDLKAADAGKPFSSDAGKK